MKIVDDMCEEHFAERKKGVVIEQKKRGRGLHKKIVDDNGKNLPIGTGKKAGGGAGRGAKAKPALVLQ